MIRLILALLMLLVFGIACGQPQKSPATMPIDSSSADPTAGSAGSATASANTSSVSSFSWSPYCEDAIENSLEEVQLWLDTVDLRGSATSEESARSKATDTSIDTGKGWVAKLSEDAGAAECNTERFALAFNDGLYDLRAVGKDAEIALEWLKYLVYIDIYEYVDALPTATATLSVDEVSWRIVSCEGAAEVFIQQTQTYLNATIEGRVKSTVEAIDQRQHHSEAFRRYDRELYRIASDFSVIGCSEEDVSQEIAPLLAGLETHGTDSELFVDAIFQVVSAGEFPLFVRKPNP